MKTLIISGGNIDFDFALDFIRKESFEFVIAADRGMEFCRQAGIQPDRIVGDFDSCDSEALQYFRRQDAQIRAYRPQKDSTDTEIAMLTALEAKSSEIVILGATGGRIDHMLGNLKNLSLALRQGVPCRIVDPCNNMYLADRPLTLKKDEQFGKYVSLLAYAEPVQNLTLKGFFYPLCGYTMTCDDAIGISNEIIEEEASIFFDKGRLIVIESRDRAGSPAA
ncbi:MAG: thiamine diphosphokinase [Eubacteriales bacterium]|nr:thiamine diphosphokinase [Eubacteriales bacterium]